VNATGASSLRSGLLLAVIAVLGVALLTAIHLLTRERIAEQERRVVLQRLAEVLPQAAFNNELLSDTVSIDDPAALKQPGQATVYRARLDGEPAAVIMRVTAVDGYNGDIVLLVGIRSDGRISGVRVVSHRETPGLGDPIERSRSSWVDSFLGRALGDPPPAQWAVRSDGGDFDQFTGATITPRAVVGAVRRALEYYQANSERLFTAPAGAVLSSAAPGGEQT
jgi:electron transport complex protein RnfG